MRIASITPDPSGYRVEVEIPNAYTDGSSRFEVRYLSRADVEGATPEAVRHAVRNLIDERETLQPLIGADLDAIPLTKATLERRMVALFDEWQRWKATQTEAIARAEPGVILNALANKTDAAWARYRAAIQEWRAAP